MRISDWSSDVCSSDLLSDASALDPDDAGAFVYRGQVYSKKKLFGDALADFDRAVLLAPKSPWPFNNRGLAHADSGDYAAAVIDYSAALAREKGTYTDYHNRGTAQLHLQKPPQALATFTKATQPNRKTCVNDKS